MDADDQADAYYQELVVLTERFKEEFDLTYAHLMGVIEMYKMELFCEAMAVVMDDDEEDEDFCDGDT
jgi:hypothetical protein